MVQSPITGMVEHGVIEEDMNINPDKIFERLTTAGELWVHADAKARMLEEAQKSELNTLAIGFLDSGKCKSMTEAEARARADDFFKQYIHDMVTAREEANEHKVRYEAAKCWFEATRTQAANMRYETKAAT